MAVWLDIILSLTLPFVALGIFSLVFAWLVHRTPVSSRALAQAQEMGPPEPPIKAVDAQGNVRHEWATDLEVQRLRRSGHRW